MLEEKEPRWRVFVRLSVVLFLFPAIVVFALPRLEAAQKLFSGDRSYWLQYWLAAFALEWVTFLVVCAAYGRVRERLQEIGFPFQLTRNEKLVAAATVLAFVLLAVLGAGGAQQYLGRIPAGARMFIPPPEAELRLFWVAMAITAALCEETLWRGVAITDLKALTNSLVLAVGLSSFSFVYFHGGFAQGAIIFGYRFFITLILAWLYVRQRNLKLVIYVHFLMDAIALLAMG